MQSEFEEFVPSSKRRRGFPSETHVKRGSRVVHGDKELLEKLGRNDLCPCGSGRKFKKCCLRHRRIRRSTQRSLFSGIENTAAGQAVPPVLHHSPEVPLRPLVSG